MIIKRWNGTFSSARSFLFTNGSTLIQGDTSGLSANMLITGNLSIPAGARIASITSIDALIMTVAATVSGSASLTFSGGFVKEFPQTTAQNIRTSADDDSIFDVNNKIKPAYLPNSVFDSLYFFSTAGATPPTVVQLTQLASNAFIDAAAQTPARSPLGYYWIQNSATGSLFAANPTGTTLVAGKYYKTIWNPAEEGEVSPVTSINLEQGDWFVITKIQGGDGSSAANAIIVTFAVVNNTYELMTGATTSDNGASGLVPQPVIANRLQFLRGDGTWATPVDTNTTYAQATTSTLGLVKLGVAAVDATVETASTTAGRFYHLGADADGNGYVNVPWTDTVYTHPNHTGDVTSAGDGATTIAAGAVGLSKMAALAASSIIGNSTANPATPTALSASAVRTLINVADGANNYVHPNHTGDVTSTGDGATVIATGAVIEAKIGTGAVTVNKIGATAVTFAKIQNIATSTIIGRVSAGTGSAESLTGSNVRSIIELAAPIYIQTTTPVASVNNALWYDIN
jgi:hypothetical protein